MAVLALSEIVAAASGGRRGRGDADAPSPRGDAGGDAGDAEDENGSSVVPLVGLDEVALGKVVASLKLRGFADEELGAALGDLETGAPPRGCGTPRAGRGTGRSSCPGTPAGPLAHRRRVLARERAEAHGR